MVELKTLEQIQLEIGQWAKENFGRQRNTLSKVDGRCLGSISPLLGVVEELGELVGPILKRHQERGYQDQEEYHQARNDAVGDLMIFLLDFCNEECINLHEVLDKTWSMVRNRSQKTWVQDKSKEVTGATLTERRMKDEYDRYRNESTRPTVTEGTVDVGPGYDPIPFSEDPLELFDEFRGDDGVWRRVYDNPTVDFPPIPLYRYRPIEGVSYRRPKHRAIAHPTAEPVEICSTDYSRTFTYAELDQCGCKSCQNIILMASGSSDVRSQTGQGWAEESE